MAFEPFKYGPVGEDVAFVSGDYLLTCGKFRLYLASSDLIASKSSTGSRPSLPEPSTTCMAGGTVDMAQKVVSEAAPSAAPSIIPGISA
jgi:hypothetical protein